jgi:hypothetical protein
MLNSLLGEIITITEVTVALTVIAVALFGSKTLSERAFRLLRWFANRAEPQRRRRQRRGPARLLAQAVRRRDRHHADAEAGVG